MPLPALCCGLLSGASVAIIDKPDFPQR